MSADDLYYKNNFIQESFSPHEALTFDDVLMVPRYSDIKSRRDVDTTSWLTPDIKLKLPVVSANMDSVTESEMAKKIALGSSYNGGGIGFIHRFNSMENQANEVEKVKRYRSYIIEDPFVIHAKETIHEAEQIMNKQKIGGLLVVDEDSNTLTGIVTRRDIYAEDKSHTVYSVMTPREKLITANYEEMKDPSKVDKARSLMHEYKIEKLPLVNRDNIPVGLIVMKDIRKLEEYPYASVNEKGNLLVGAAVGVVGDYMERAERLVASGVDVIVSDVAHAHHISVKESIKEIKNKFDIPVVAGTIATAEGFEFLARAGADSIACGVGSGCFGAGTRVLMGSGVYKNIEDIQAGDYVINKDGISVKVNKAWMTGVKKVNKLRHTQSMDPIYVTPDHRFWAGDYSNVPEYVQPSKGYATAIKHDKANIHWMPIGGAIKNVSLLSPGNIQYDWEDDFVINLKDYSQRDKSLEAYTQEVTSSYDLGYIFGTFLGDGSALYTHKSKDCSDYIGRISWYFGKEEREITNKLRTIVERTFGKQTVLKETDNLNIVHFYSKQWAKFFNDFGKRSKKFLPEKYLVNNMEYLQGLFDGLIDSDGSREKQVLPENERICLSNTSPQIIELFAVISQKLFGSFPSMTSRAKTAGNLIGCNPDNLNTVYVSRLDSGHSRRQIDDYQIVKICENTETEIEIPVYDIEVDCPSHSFIANNTIVHNSICSTRLVAGHGMPQLQALYECYEVQQEKYPHVSLIADGGIRKPADFDKAMVFADLIKMGSMLAGTPESPGEISRDENGQSVKIYRGMASKEAFEDKLESEGASDRMKRSAEYTPEGISVKIMTKPPVEQLLNKFAGGLRSAMSYTGSRTISEYKKNAKFVRITNAGVLESDTHIRHR